MYKRQVLDVQNVTMHNAQHKKDDVKNVSFQVRGGEIVCLAGIEGNGQTCLLYTSWMLTYETTVKTL